MLKLISYIFLNVSTIFLAIFIVSPSSSLTLQSSLLKSK